MRLNLHLLRVFHHVVEEGSFSAAARSLHISQPAVSKAVAELERQLDLTLLERSGSKSTRRLRPTDAGESLNAHARAIFSLERAAVQELERRSGLRQGELVIGASTTVASYWLPACLQAYAQEWPDISLRVVVANTQAIVEDLFDCQIDVGLVEGPVHMDGVAYYPWREERLVIVAPPALSQVGVAGADGVRRVPAHWLGAHRWLVRETGSGTREVTIDLLARQGVVPHDRMEIGSNEGIARAVAAGLGLAMLPYALVEDLIALGRVIELQAEGITGLSRRLYRLERQDRPPSPPVGAFLDVLARMAN